jgi:hypothetical protein
MYPDWLPLPLNLRGSYDENIKELLEVFNRDFISSNNPVVDGYRVIVNNNLDPSWQNLQLTYGFTHMITRGNGLRVIDYDRANKLPWVRAILDNYKQPEVTAFWAEHIKGDRLYLWLEEHDFVVILSPLVSKRASLNSESIIVTAYSVDSYRNFSKIRDRVTRFL